MNWLNYLLKNMLISVTSITVFHMCFHQNKLYSWSALDFDGSGDMLFI